MSGEFENENSDYLSYFGFNSESSVEEKIAVFSNEVIHTSFDISNELLNNPNYRYGDIEKVNYLTQLRNDILECGKLTISDSLNMRFDYICIKCKKENGNMFSERYLGSYYSDANNIIEDLIPYLLPQQKDTYQKNQYTNIEKELVKIVVQ